MSRREREKKWCCIPSAHKAREDPGIYCRNLLPQFLEIDSFPPRLLCEFKSINKKEKIDR